MRDAVEKVDRNPGRKPSDATALDGLIHQRLVGPVIFMGERCFVGGAAVPRYTTSLDAASHLVGDLLPGWTISICLGPDGATIAMKGLVGGEDCDLEHSVGRQVAGLGLCTLLFAVIEAMTTGCKPDVQHGISALRSLLDAEKDAFGRRSIATIDLADLVGA